MQDDKPGWSDLPIASKILATLITGGAIIIIGAVVVGFCGLAIRLAIWCCGG